MRHDLIFSYLEIIAQSSESAQSNESRNPPISKRRFLGEFNDANGLRFTSPQAVRSLRG